MKPMNYTEARANLASVLDSATEDLEEVVITRGGHSPAVVIALNEYEALKETAHLLGNPANARHLERSIAEHRSGGAGPRELVDVDGAATEEVSTPPTPQQRHTVPSALRTLGLTLVSAPRIHVPGAATADATDGEILDMLTSWAAGLSSAADESSVAQLLVELLKGKVLTVGDRAFYVRGANADQAKSELSQTSSSASRSEMAEVDM